MRYKNIEIINVINFLNKFGDMKLPAKITFAIIKNQNYFQKEYQDYVSALGKVYDVYSDNFKKNKNGDLVTGDNGVPVITDKKILKKFEDEISNLLSLDVDVQRFYIEENAFDYDDSKYDILTPKDMYTLMNFLCAEEEGRKE